MKIVDLYGGGKPLLSLEIFPPRADYPIDVIFDTLEHLRNLNPGFISVTYGANRARTVEIAARIKKEYGIESLAHLTCVRHTRAEVGEILDQLIKEGINNILALRGDLPEDEPDFDINMQEYRYAYELINDVHQKNEFGVAAAAYPGGHTECLRLKDDLVNLKHKVDCGVDFLITQFFFDNRIYYDFLDKLESMQIACPIVPGIMPILNARQIKRMIYLSGASIPGNLLKLVDKYDNDPASMERAGIEFASNQVRDLMESKVPGIHLYTMNKHSQITEIVKNVGLA